MLPSNAYGIGAWDHHIELVYKIAIEICDDYGADYNVVALSALLHDIASVTDKSYTEEHRVIGSQIAHDLLKKQKAVTCNIKIIMILCMQMKESS